MANARCNISSKSPFEPEIGFSRAVRVGDVIAVGGTAPIADDGSTAAPGDVYQQTKRCIEISLKAIAAAGGDPTSVVRTRIMLTSPVHWREAARAHGETFGNVKPASTFVVVKGFIDPDWLVETEMDCVVSEKR